MKDTLESLVREMPVWWCLSHYSKGGYWVVWNTDSGATLGGGSSPEEALIEARDKPMTSRKAAYYPRYGWSLFGKE